MSASDVYKAFRGPAWNTVFDLLRGHRLTKTYDEMDNGYPLVDALTPEGSTIEEGEWEMILLADDITASLDIY